MCIILLRRIVLENLSSTSQPEIKRLSSYCIIKTYTLIYYNINKIKKENIKTKMQRVRFSNVMRVINFKCNSCMFGEIVLNVFIFTFLFLFLIESIEIVAFDRVIFESENDFSLCIKQSFPRLKTLKLRRKQWCILRSLIGKPRRYGINQIFSFINAINR